jgi:cytochrome P450
MQSPEYSFTTGPLFYFALNRDIFLVPTSPSLMREILHGTTGNAGLYRKDPADAEALEPLLGSDGLLFAANERWARHRKVLNPEFHVGKLKVGE